ncbi:hypothetical protein [Sphaerisporangium fuscum]|uniref:hypothetical protein n=1 Tax=Sphaerisporangium fuscum TaxID=2835868 RepID=UPI0020299CB6|nr:hypothetical protein [Sphaerisporangium fuscum]
MATPVEAAPRPPSWSSRGPVWAPYAAAVWGPLYAAVEVTWAATGTTVPWRPGDPYPAAVQLVLALAAVTAAGACLLGARAPGRAGRTVATAALAVTIPVFAVGLVALPVEFVTLASGAGVESATGLAQILLNSAGAALLTLSAVVLRRRARGRCVRCGQDHPGAGGGPLVHPTPSTASRRARLAAFALLGGLLPWAGVKTIWTLGGDALGLTAEQWRRINAGAPLSAHALASVGIDVTVLAAMLGVFLALGLLYRWGMRFPRWVPFLSGTRVPRLLPLIPAWLTSAGLSVYGIGIMVYVTLTVLGVLPAAGPSDGFTAAGITWMAVFGGLAFGGLGLALLTGARSYAARTRPICGS